MTGRLLLAVMLLPAALPAQDSVIVIDPNAPPAPPQMETTLPDSLLRLAVARFNDTTAVRFHQSLAVPAGARLVSPVALFRGTLSVAGTIEGPVTVVNGDMVILPGGQVLGDIVVVGGGVTISPGGFHRGAAIRHPALAEVYRANDGLLMVSRPGRPLGELEAEKVFGIGDWRALVNLSLGGTYNRVEGLPLYLTPGLRYRSGERDELALDLRAIVRTVGDPSGLRADFGYWLRLGWERGTRRQLKVNLIWRSEVLGIENQPLSRSENGWSAFLLQRDYRDHYQSQGIGLTVSAVLAPTATVDFGIRRDTERSLPAADPWSLFRNSDRWRPNPLIDDGTYLTGNVGLTWDTRNSRQFPSTGWLIRAGWELATSDDVTPRRLPPGVRDPLPAGRSYTFHRLSFDARNYFRLSPGLRAGIRGIVAGHLGGDPLPTQRRYSIGGTDLLPGYRFREVTCAPAGASEPASAALCDRMAALQLELRTRLRLGWALRLPDRERRELNRVLAIDQADLVLFTNAGTAWLSGDGPGQVPSNRLPALSEWKADIGAGVDLGGVGFYFAKALTDAIPVRFTVRLQRRF